MQNYMQFELYCDGSGKFRFRGLDKHGNEVLRSNSYDSKDAAMQALDFMKAAAVEGDIIDRTDERDLKNP